jgi:signal transduction histidine kinase
VYCLEVEPTGVDPVHISQVSFLVVVGAGLVLLAVTWIIVDRVVARPLGEVVRGANRVAVGDYGTPVPSSGVDDEIQKVIAAFNSMMIEIGALQGRMRERTQDALLTAKKTQDSLVIAQRLASTGRLAAGIAHEVNNPLAGMLNAVHSLRTKDMAPAKRDEYLEIVEDGLRRIQATVAKILQFTPHSVAPRRVDVQDVVRPVLALARHRIEKEEVEVVATPSPEPAVVFGDPYELQQALLNVVLNALDALEEAHRETPRVEVTTTVAHDEVRLLVRDNGVGMKDEDVPRAFDLFFTTKEPGHGTGLGLATAHKILTDHGGRIDLRSRGTDGMDVEFVLPRFGQ